MPAVRSVRAESGDAAVDQRGKLRAQEVVADAPLVEGAGLEVLDQHVGGLSDFMANGAAAVRREVEADRTLVAVGADEIGRVVVVKRRAPVAGLVARRRLHLHDVRAVVGENLRAVGTAEHARQIDHAQSGHRSGLMSSGQPSINGEQKTRPQVAARRHIERIRERRQYRGRCGIHAGLHAALRWFSKRTLRMARLESHSGDQAG